MSNSSRYVVCVGASHRTASLAVRERFALVGSRGRDLCAQLAAATCINEVAAIATCNRSEVYLVGSDSDTMVAAAIEAFAQLASANRDEMSTMIEVHVGRDAAEHLFRVAGGIESVVVGEAQIQGQVRQAHEQARESGTCGALLDQLFRRAIEIGKHARTDTSIGEGHASVGSVAAELIASCVTDIHDAHIAVIGAGKMGDLAVRSLAARGVQRIDVANRNPERAAQLVERCTVTGVALGLDELDAEIARCDALVSCTDAPHLVIAPERIERVMRDRDGRPLVLVDLAVPRDIDPACGAIEHVHVFDLDDLERVVAETIEVRSDAVDLVAQLASEGADDFVRWQRAQAATPQIRAMRERAEEIRRAELDRTLQRMEHLSEDDRERIDLLTRGIVNRLLHAPTMQLREAAERS